MAGGRLKQEDMIVVPLNCKRYGDGGCVASGEVHPQVSTNKDVRVFRTFSDEVSRAECLSSMQLWSRAGLVWRLPGLSIADSGDVVQKLMDAAAYEGWSTVNNECCCAHFNVICMSYVFFIFNDEEC